MPLSRRAFAAALVACVAATPVRAQGTGPAVVLIDTAVLTSPLLDESSGIVASRRRPGLYWTHNDSGDGPTLYVTDSTGAGLGRVVVDGAQNLDWEDLAIGPCTRSAGTCLYIGDVGDNNASRRSVSIYVVPEPDPPADARAAPTRVAVEDTIILRYPDHPHDAEALAVIGGWLYLVTKDRAGPPLMFRSPARVTGPRVLSLVGALPINTGILRGRLVTGAASSGDGRLLVLRTYVSLHLFLMNDGTPTPLTGRDGISIPVVETQGEGVCIDSRGLLVLIGERGRLHHAIIARLRLTGVPAP